MAAILRNRATLLGMAAAVVVSFVLPCSAKKLSERDFPLKVDVESFELRSFDTPISYLGHVVANVENQEVVVHASVDGKHYVVSCTTQDVGCAKLLPGTYQGRWGKKGLEVFTTNEKGKPSKTIYNVLSASQ